MEKIKPSESLSSISSLKFQKKTDYKKFLNFIKSETEELEKIGAPSEDKIKNILKVGGIGLLGFGLFNLLGKKDKGDKEKIEGKGESGDFQIPFGIGRQTNDLPKTVLPNIKPFGEKPTGQSQKIKIKTPVTTKVSKPARRQVKNRVKKNINVRKKVTVGNQTIIKPKPGEIEKSKNILKKFPEQLRLFEDKDKNVPDDGGKAGQARIEKELGLSDSDRVAKGLGDADPGKQLKGQFSDLKTKRENVVKNKGKKLFGIGKFIEKFMNFYNKGRNVRFPDENNAKLIDLFLDDLKQMTHSDKAFKTGKTGIGTLRPFKAFTPNMLKTGPTPLTRQLIERPFRSLFRAGASGLKFLKNNPLVNALLKSKVAKTGLIVVDGLFAVQEFYDLFVRPGDNVFTTLYDLYVSVNNAYFQNDPERLKYFITESKGSGRMFGVGATNEQIRRKEIERNLRIKRLKEAAAVEGGGGDGGNNIVIVPFENKKQSAASNSGIIPFVQDTTGNIIIPTSEPLNIGDNILLQKLNQ